jgi:hypothetical protein
MQYGGGYDGGDVGCSPVQGGGGVGERMTNERSRRAVFSGHGGWRAVFFDASHWSGGRQAQRAAEAHGSSSPAQDDMDRSQCAEAGAYGGLAEPSDDVPIQRRIWASGLSEDAKRLVERVLLRAVNVREAETMTNHMKLESESVKVIIA